MRYTMDIPGVPRGTADEKIAKMYSWLYQMNEQLTVTLSNIDQDNMSVTTQSMISESATQEGVSKELAHQYDLLRSLVVKTADTVRAEMDEIVTELRGSYLALSEWGVFQQTLSNTITSTAEGVVQQYGYGSRLDSADESIADFMSYKVNTQQYIKTGMLYYDESQVPRYGVAVGEKLSTVIVDGKEVLTRQDLCATFTSDKLSFWQGGSEVAYLSNSKLYITNAEILGTIIMGDWEIRHDNGFEISYIGG